MYNTQEPPPQSHPVRDALYGAIPATIGTVLVLLHLRAPLVPPEYQSVLMNGWLGLICATLSYWLYRALRAVADRICAEFDTRHDELLALMEAHAEASSRDFRAAMAKLAKTCKKLETIERENKEMKEEVEHLRSLLLEIRPLTGPSPYS